MTESRAFLVQARSDFRAFLALSEADLPSCHRLHQLQMCVEKLAKAIALRGNRGAIGRTHKAWSKVAGALEAQRSIAALLDMKVGDYRFFIQRAGRIGRAIEELHPQLATSGVPDAANVEYPWSETLKRGGQRWIAPAEHMFDVEARLRSSDGAMLLKLLGVLLAHFDRIFG